KVPMQFFILLVGIMVFVFYQFNQAPINFNPNATEFVLNSEFSNEYKSLQEEGKIIFNDKQKHINAYINSESSEASNYISSTNAANDELRNKAKSLIAEAAEKEKIKIEHNDVDYVFIYFILNNLPRGLIGLLLA